MRPFCEEHQMHWIHEPVNHGIARCPKCTERARAEAARLNAEERKRQAANAMYEALILAENALVCHPSHDKPGSATYLAMTEVRAALRLADGEEG